MHISLSKRVLALSFAVVIIGSLFAACGGDDNKAKPNRGSNGGRHHQSIDSGHRIVSDRHGY